VNLTLKTNPPGKTLIKLSLKEEFY